jgi:hypothetical protein
MKRGAVMIGILILSLSILFAGALPWWPYSASARSRHHRPWDWLIDQGRITSHVAIKGATRLEGDQTAALAEQLAAVCEKSHVRGRHEPQPDRLVA